MHTPGPWEVYEVEDGPYNEVIARGICESRHGVGLNHGEQYELFSEDDARLIAAAPDLLSACEELLAAFEGYEMLAALDASVQDKARAAIAKARGEATS